MPGIFGTTPPTPQVAVAPAMPTSKTPSVIEAQNNAAITATQRQGRASTILGKQAPTIADSYSGKTTGASS